MSEHIAVACETGLIGQVLYLAAEAAGVRSTGMGCYFDDLVHRLLDLNPSDDSWQSLYHFTVGGAVDDERLSALAAYGHLPAEPISPFRRGGCVQVSGRANRGPVSPLSLMRAPHRLVENQRRQWCGCETLVLTGNYPPKPGPNRPRS